MTFGGKSYPEQVQLLDQLQKEVNVVLEQTGRLLATSNSNNKAVIAAQATKLKAVLPGAEARFNDALDNLGEEIEHAKLILRRDLAIAREKAGMPKLKTAVTSTQQRTSPKRTSPDGEGEAPDAKRMRLTPDAVPPQAVSSAHTETTGNTSAAAPPIGNEVASAETDSSKQAPSTPPSAPEEQKTSPSAPAKPTATSSDDTKELPSEAQDSTASAKPSDKSADPNLSINTQPTSNPTDQPQQDSSKPPDTALTTNADLDSLFGGPTTSVPNAGGEPADDAFDPANLTGGGDFDFGLPANNGGDMLDGGDDNISALLPGLQDYANNNPLDGTAMDGGGDPDFDAIFNTDLGQDAAGGDGAGMGGFLDFDFEKEFGLAAEGGGAGEGDGNAGGQGQNQNGDDDFFNF